MHVVGRNEERDAGRGDYGMTWGGDGVHGSVQEGEMQGSTCDAMQGCVGSTEDEASGRAIRYDMQVRMYVVAGARPWSPMVCCRSIVDMSTVDCAIRPVQVVGGDRHRHSLATDVGGITWSGDGGGSGADRDVDAGERLRR